MQATPASVGYNNTLSIANIESFHDLSKYFLGNVEKNMT